MVDDTSGVQRSVKVRGKDLNGKVVGVIVKSCVWRLTRRLAPPGAHP
jgi:hypothetical protein